MLILSVPHGFVWQARRSLYDVMMGYCPAEGWGGDAGVDGHRVNGKAPYDH